MKMIVELNSGNNILTEMVTQNNLETAIIPYSGAGGTTDYNKLKNKPSIEQIELNGNKSFNDLGLIPITIQEINNLF